MTLEELIAERRYMMLYVSAEVIKEIICHYCTIDNEFIPPSSEEQRILVAEGIPEGAVINGDAHYSYERDAFAFRVFHESFDPVLLGAYPPAINLWYRSKPKVSV